MTSLKIWIKKIDECVHERPILSRGKLIDLDKFEMRIPCNRSTERKLFVSFISIECLTLSEYLSSCMSKSAGRFDDFMAHAFTGILLSLSLTDSVHKIQMV